MSLLKMTLTWYSSNCSCLPRWLWERRSLRLPRGVFLCLGLDRTPLSGGRRRMPTAVSHTSKRPMSQMLSTIKMCQQTRMVSISSGKFYNRGKYQYIFCSRTWWKLVCNFFPRHLCECGAGYRAYQDPDLDGATVCVDEDECQLGTHSCQPSAKCWNTPGSYQCYCPHSQQSDLDHCSTGIDL